VSAVRAYFAARGGILWWAVLVAPPVLLGLLLPGLDWLVTRAASRATDWENHATETA
jgi:anoctamin-10